MSLTLDDERGGTVTKDARDLLDSHLMDRGDKRWTTFARRLACQPKLEELLGRPTFALGATVGNLRVSTGERRLVAQIFPRWNPLTSWMRQIEDFQRAA